MKEEIEDYKCLASYAFFRELYDSHNDIYTIIEEFIKQTIIKRKIYHFTIIQITRYINDDYEFDLQQAIIKKAIKKIEFIKKENGEYVCNNTNMEINSIVNNNNDTISINESFINNLITYIEKRKKTKIDECEKKLINKSFCSYMLNDSFQDEYSKYISAYILNLKTNISELDKLNKIKEGIILYSGIKYNNNFDENTWNTELTIYIDTEILFHFAGFNGELFRDIFMDFYKFIIEINSYNLNRTRKKLIHLHYFKETLDEIESFFKKAERIIDGKEILDPSKTAMKTITDGCFTKSDIIKKKSDFYILLNNNGITVDETNYYTQQNYIYNIEDSDLINHFNKKYNFSDSLIKEGLRFLNYINILRKNNVNTSFEKIKYIFLTGNISVLKIAWDDKIKINSNVPLATSLEFLTNKFWFKLGKGFGNNQYPKTFSVITKAQLILSSLLNNSVSEKYLDLTKQLRENNITRESATNVIYTLRNESKNAEEINDGEGVLDFISESDINKYSEEISLKEIELQKTIEKNKRLEEKLIKEKRKNYFRDRKDYISIRNSHFKNLIIKKNIKQTIPVIIFIILFISNFLIYILIDNNYRNIGIKVLSSLFSIFIIYFSPFINKRSIQNSFYFLTRPKYRKYCNNYFINKELRSYMKDHHPKTLKE